MDIYNFNTENKEGWNSTNPFNNDYRELHDECGVYSISVHDCSNQLRKLVYIGFSTKLKLRISRHELLRFLRATYDGTDLIPVVKYCVIKDVNDAKVMEMSLINAYNPMYNIKKS